MLTKEDKIKNLVGNYQEIKALPCEVFSDEHGDFLDDLSKSLRQSEVAREFSDIQAFSFWIRKTNYQYLRNNINQKNTRIGRGIAFHIAPSNVPINFAYSLVFGIMSGNSNIIRVSSREFLQVDIICSHINTLIDRYSKLKHQICILRYEANKLITDYFSSICNARIIWGGDQTIQEIRKSAIMPRAIEVNFADRFSFAVINPETVIRLDSAQLKKLATDFYNDTYLMDQMACTSPHIVFWKNNGNVDVSKASELFWKSVCEVVKEKYDLTGVKVTEKFTNLCKRFAVQNNIISLKQYENYLYVIQLGCINSSFEDFKGYFGLFYEYVINSYSELSHYINEKIQTCSYFGIERNELIEFIFKNKLTGIDRVVPIGKTLDISLMWDGYDVIAYLSRAIG